ncbi:hypothetical protein T03_5533 [Trichinella britovi]|uniref:Uncharacterized protein n=1 Tax=Trichinella britovi TaxID=45882 RepID=A0A0V1CUI3_TRIBR|nr:hypothetical protein T03_5533 [Trichinella britovi]
MHVVNCNSALHCYLRMSTTLTKCCMWTNFHIHNEQCKAIELQKVIKKIAIQHKDFDIQHRLHHITLIPTVASILSRHS